MGEWKIMMCSAYFGRLSEKRKLSWDNGDDNPCDVLESRICLEGKGHDLLHSGSDYFKDRIQIDWGSFAWKCTPEEISRFLCDHKTTLSWLVKSEEELIKNVKAYIAEDENAEFGVIFIEES